MCSFEGTCKKLGPVAQLVRAPPCHGGGQGFEPLSGRLLNNFQLQLNIWGLSSAGRASALQAEGHRFEPYWSHLFAGVAELADAQDLKSCGTYIPVPVRPRSPAFITTAVVIIMEYSIRTCSSAG